MPACGLAGADGAAVAVEAAAGLAGGRTGWAAGGGGVAAALRTGAAVTWDAFFTARIALDGGVGLAGGEPVEPVAAAVPAGGGVPFPRIRARMRVASSSLIELLWLLAAMESFSAASSTSLFSRPRSRDSS
jgi:hypothetical protein